MWKDWPQDLEFSYNWLNFRSQTAVMMGPLDVHALAFGHPLAGWNLFQRWDCISGFTKPLVEDPIW